MEAITIIISLNLLIAKWLFGGNPITLSNFNIVDEAK